MPRQKPADKNTDARRFKSGGAGIPALILASVTILILIVTSVLYYRQNKSAPNISSGPDGSFAFYDDLGYLIGLPREPERVVSLMGSYSDLWLLAGGALCGVTEDAVSERGLSLDAGVSVIGSVHNPNIELIVDLSPELVLLSADLGAHKNLRETLTQAGLACAYFKEDSVDDYLRMLDIFTSLTGRADLYEEYGVALKARIDALLSRIPAGRAKPKVLLIRATTTAAKALKDDHMTGIMLADLGATNIASRYESLLEDLSLELILDEDPDFIFVVTTGDTDKSLAALQSGLMANPAWQGLSAARNGRFHVLPKELFHYKPNARWGESYEYLFEILYP